MSLYNRPGSSFIWFKFTIGKRRVRESSGTADRQLAEQVEARRKRELWEEARLGVAIPRLWQKAVIDYLAEMPESKTKRNTRYTLNWLRPHLDGWHVANIDRAKLKSIRDAKIADINRKKQALQAAGTPSRWPTAQPSAVNRVMGVVIAILNKCESWEWIKYAPTIAAVSVAKTEKPWADRARALKLISLLPAHQIPMVIYDLSVGWRKHNVTHLAWPQVALERRFAWVTPEAAKEGKGIPTPLPDIAVEVLEGQLGKDPVWVFPYRGKPVEQTSTRAFRRARDAAGLPPNFTWHSLRHTWASWMAQDGVPTAVLRELGGWSSDKMPALYAHHGAEHLRPFVDGRVSLSSEAVQQALGTKEGTARKRKSAEKSVTD